MFYTTHHLCVFFQSEDLYISLPQKGTVIGQVVILDLETALHHICAMMPDSLHRVIVYCF